MSKAITDVISKIIPTDTDIGTISFEDEKIIEKILRHLVLWARKARPPPKAKVQPLNVRIDYADSQSPPSDDYLYCDPDYPIETYATD